MIHLAIWASHQASSHFHPNSRTRLQEAPCKLTIELMLAAQPLGEPSLSATVFPVFVNKALLLVLVSMRANCGLLGLPVKFQ